MRNSILDSPQLRFEAARKKENLLKGMKRKGGTNFVEESGLLILIKRITKAQSNEITKRTAISLTVWRLRMEDHGRKGLDVRGPHMGNLTVKGVKERGPIYRGNTETSQDMMSLDTTSMTRR
jgi:hypothetical protein